MHSKTVFMFSGQGSQYFQMGKQLFESNPVFRDWMLHLDGLVNRLCGHGVVQAIYGSPKSEEFSKTALTHPAIFMIEYSLAQCLMDQGLHPDLTLGASLGSFAAAAVGGHLGAEEALAAVVEQARTFAATCGRGSMVAVLAEPALFDQPWLGQWSELSGVNLKNHFSVSAPQGALPGLEQALRDRGVTFQRLAVEHAYHSRWIEGAAAPYLQYLRTLPQRRGALRLVCCEQARTLQELPADFFWRVVRHPIRFKDTVEHLERQGPWHYIDVGPSGTLATFVKYLLEPGSASTAAPTLTPFGQDLKNLAALAAAR